MVVVLCPLQIEAYFQAQKEISQCQSHYLKIDIAHAAKMCKKRLYVKQRISMKNSSYKMRIYKIE